MHGDVRCINFYDESHVQSFSKKLACRAQDTNFNRFQSVQYDLCGPWRVYTFFIAFALPQKRCGLWTREAVKARVNFFREEESFRSQFLVEWLASFQNIYQSFNAAKLYIQSNQLLNSAKTDLKLRNEDIGNVTKLVTDYFDQKGKLKRILQGKSDILDYSKKIQLAYAKHFPMASENIMALLRYEKALPTGFGYEKVNLLTDEVYYLSIMEKLIKFVCASPNNIFYSIALEALLADLVPKWHEILPKDGVYRALNGKRSDFKFASYYTNFLNDFFHNHPHKLRVLIALLDPLQSRLLEELVNVFIFIHAHAVRLERGWRKMLPEVEALVQQLQEKHLVPLVDLLVDHMQSLVSKITKKKLSALTKPISDCLSLMLTQFAHANQDSENADELCSRFNSAVDAVLASFDPKPMTKPRPKQTP